METVDVKHQPGSQFEVDLNNSSLEPLSMVIATDIPQRYLTKLVEEISPVSHKRLAYLVTILLQELPRPKGLPSISQSQYSKGTEVLILQTDLIIKSTQLDLRDKNAQ